MTSRDVDRAAAVSEPGGAVSAGRPLTVGRRRPSARRATGRSRDALSRNSYAPLYYQLTANLEERIESGEYAPGMEFPSERDLCEEFDVSRTVVRPAMAILEREGRIGRARGKRTVVRAPKAVHRMGGLLRRLQANRTQTASALRVLESKHEAADRETAAVLGLGEGEPVLRVAAVAYEDSVPLALHWSYLPAARFGWLSALPVGEHLTGTERGIPMLELSRGEATVESSWCTEFEAAELDIPVGSPIFVVRSIEHAFESSEPTHAVEVAWTMYRADAARLQVALGPTTSRPEQAQ